MEVQDLDIPIINTKITSKVAIPSGYIPIELSTNGKLGVPKVVHVRNFSTGDLVELSLYNKETLPENVIKVLNNLVYEKVDVSNWPDKIIIELMIKIYTNYFTPIVYDVVFPWSDEDIQFLESKNRFEEAMALKSGKWSPTLDLDLRTLDTIAIDDTVKSYITIRNRATSTTSALEVKFLSYPKFGDIITINKAMEERFYEEDKKYARIRQDSELRERYIQEGRNMELITPLDPGSYLAWQKYELRKSLYLMKAAQALYLTSFNGKDLSNSTLDEKISILDNPEFDVNVGKAIEDQYSKLNFGINNNVKVKNPITGEFELRRFSFRFMDILQAIQSSKSPEYDIFYDD